MTFHYYSVDFVYAGEICSTDFFCMYKFVKSCWFVDCWRKGGKNLYIISEVGWWRNVYNYAVWMGELINLI